MGAAQGPAGSDDTIQGEGPGSTSQSDDVTIGVGWAQVNARKWSDQQGGGAMGTAGHGHITKREGPGG